MILFKDYFLNGGEIIGNIRGTNLPIRVFNARKRSLPFYCKDITTNTMEEVCTEVYVFWECPIGIYCLLINGIKKTEPKETDSESEKEDESEELEEIKEDIGQKKKQKK